MSLNIVKGIGPKRISALNEAGIFTIKELIHTMPKGYHERLISKKADLNDHTQVHVAGVVVQKPTVFFIRKNLSRLSLKVIIEGEQYSVFVFNQHYLKRVLNEGSNVVVYGKLNQNKRSITATKVFLKDNFNEGYEPIYGIDAIPDKTLNQMILNALDLSGVDVEETLPISFITKHDLISKKRMIEIAHQPTSADDYEHIKRRLKLEEMFLFHVKLLNMKQLRTKSVKRTPYNETALHEILNRVPFTLTTAQNRVISELKTDLDKPRLMNRMLQGDTGSGKTLMALVAATIAVLRQTQVALMAPTDLLARQHYNKACEFYAKTNIKVVYLSQSQDKHEQQAALDAIHGGQADFIIGTHKLFSHAVTYHNLKLVIIDEQHRFGVNQREALLKKGSHVDCLYLTATPIPRTLAHIVFGDMDQSVLDEKPAERLPVDTEAITLGSTKTLRHIIKNTLEDNAQMFVVSPTIEASDQIKHSATSLYKQYATYFKDSKVALLHGQMDKNKQQQILESFKLGDIDILITTTIIEVGVDIKGATLMIVYHAERFGFAQLHQLRGRVGRHNKPSRCVFVYQQTDTSEPRMQAMCDTQDGFLLSEMDLKLRGHGDLIGTMQSGYLPFEHVDITRDMGMFKSVKADALSWLKQSKHDEHQ